MNTNKIQTSDVSMVKGFSLMMSLIISLIVSLMVMALFSCGESEELVQLRLEIAEAEKVNASLIEESKAAGYEVSQELQRSLEAHAILFATYYEREGDIDTEMTETLIKYLEYYKENSDYLETDPSYQAYLPLAYGIQSSLYDQIGERTLATESTKQSLRGFEELLEDFPDDPLLNIYYALILGSIPNVFKADKKAWEQLLLVDKMLVENEWEDSVPMGLREKLYSRAIDLSKKLSKKVAEDGSTSSDKTDYFEAKLNNLKNNLE